MRDAFLQFIKDLSVEVPISYDRLELRFGKVGGCSIGYNPGFMLDGFEFTRGDWIEVKDEELDIMIQIGRDHAGQLLPFDDLFTLPIKADLKAGNLKEAAQQFRIELLAFVLRTFVDYPQKFLVWLERIKDNAYKTGDRERRLKIQQALGLAPENTLQVSSEYMNS